MAILREVLEQTSFGQGVAENEQEGLASFFVSTGYWRSVVADEVDITFGVKGSGKSVLYALLLGETHNLRGSGTIVVAGENPRGAPVFRDLVKGDAPDEQEFEDLWRLYFLALVARVLKEEGVGGGEAGEVTQAMETAGLLARDRNLAGLVGAIRDWLRRSLSPESAEQSVTINPETGAPTFANRISLREPGTSEAAAGTVSLQTLLSRADDTLRAAGLKVWVALDRLDVAFSGASDLERRGLRSLLRVYLDFRGFDQIELKIFLRSDLTGQLMEGGFTEASHLTRTATINWESRPLLVNLVTKRLLASDALVEYLGLDRNAILADYGQQEALLQRLLPSSQGLEGFDWILEHCKNGSDWPAPREIIQLLEGLRKLQLQRLEIGQPEPSGSAIFEAELLLEALGVVSRARLERTIYAEFDKEQPFVARLEGQRATLSLNELRALWGVDAGETRSIAEAIVEIGVFRRTKGSGGEPSYSVAPLYRPALATT